VSEPAPHERLWLAGDVTTWLPGRTIVVQEIWREQVWAARPMTVVEDGDTLALWFPRGTRWQAPTSPPTRPRAATRGERLALCAVRVDWVFTEATWDVDTLVLVRPGDWHAVWVSWLPDGTHWGWYVNLQEPFRRTPLGIQTMDLMLDVIVDPDGSWRWKDEDELDEFVAQGAFDSALAGHVRAEALRAVDRALRRDPPFDDSWLRWRPDPAWPHPRLPAHWNELCP
jgi:hypothetical protein